MFTSNVAVRPPVDIKLTVDEQTFHLRYVGPSFNGWIYRPFDPSACYRLVALEDMSLERRQTLRQWADSGSIPGLARVTHCWQDQSLPGYYVIRYEIEDFCETFAERLKRGDPVAGVDAVLAVCDKVDGWWEKLFKPLLPMPADIAFSSTGDAYLLPVPFSRLPDIHCILADGRRALYLSPQFLRSQVTDDGWNDVDLHAIGIALLECFFEPTQLVPNDALLHSAIGEPTFTEDWKPSVPFWLYRAQAARETVQLARRMLQHDRERRGQLTLDEIRNLLAICRSRMEPEAALHDVRKKETVIAAFALLRDMLLEDESYDLCVKGGELAGEMHRPLEAIDYYERAIKRDETAVDAYLKQFELIIEASKLEYGPLHDLYERNIELAKYLDHKAWRDFDQIEKSAPTMARRLELDNSMHLLWRGRQLTTFFTSAAEFIRPRLFDQKNKYLPWKFRLNLAYAEALAGQGRLAEALQHAGTVRRSIDQYGDRREIDKSELRRARAWLDELEQRITKRLAEEPASEQTPTLKD